MDSIENLRAALKKASENESGQMVRVLAGWVVDAAGCASEGDEIVNSLLKACEKFPRGHRLFINQCDCEHLIEGCKTQCGREPEQRLSVPSKPPGHQWKSW